ncbi:hypothetical protein J437_LFUL010976 [Ladona fulva]|uniref:Major facilitator superfamily domain-containing protein 12-like n=1 Tax=Ladona fulva TaxID=123851 RepID=A0A8K0K8G4_LADFU|nr:hypothetical protein J437_LFUL010976 [Ladona fulva]
MADNTIGRRLPLVLRASYGVGHVLNDVCASMWFTYLLVFFHLVLKFNSAFSGLVLLIGQVADAIATPFVGIESDRTDDFWLCRYGRRKTWHLLELTADEHERTELTAIRYSFTVISNILVYLITWAVLHVTNENEDDQIGPKDIHKFQHIVFIGIAIGIISSIVFHVGVKEDNDSHMPQDVEVRRQLSINQRRGSLMTAAKFFQEIQFYQVALLYMATRLFVNLTQVYIPLYLHESLSMAAENLAIIPLVMFVSSFVFSFVVKFLNRYCGRKISYLIGCLIGMAPCMWVWFGSGNNYATYEIYAVAVLFGAGSSIMLVTSLGITADLIAHNTETGAFVYGAMSFADKLSNGLAVTLIQDFKCILDCPNYYRDILSFVCGGAAVFGLIILATLAPFVIGSRRKVVPYLKVDDEMESVDDADINNTTVQAG